VLAALTLALRRFGPALPSRRALVVTALLISLVATLVTVALAAGSAAYDYSLQSAELQMMQGMPGMQSDCSAHCQSQQYWMTLGAHGRAIGYTSIAVFVTNAVLVGWLVAMRGGRLSVSGRGLAATGSAGAAGGRAQHVRRLMLAALVGCAAIHAAVVPEHLEEWAAAGLFFVVLTAAEIAVAAVVTRPGRPPLLAVVAVSVVPLGVWLVSRTVGLPFGPDPGAAEAVGLADCVSCVLELGTLVAAVLLLRGSTNDPARPPLPPHHRALAVAAVVALGALGVAAAAPAWFDGADGSAGGVETDHHHSAVEPGQR
jgi:hypothetical protein